MRLHTYTLGGAVRWGCLAFASLALGSVLIDAARARTMTCCQQSARSSALTSRPAAMHHTRSALPASDTRSPRACLLVPFAGVLVGVSLTRCASSVDQHPDAHRLSERSRAARLSVALCDASSAFGGQHQHLAVNPREAERNAALEVGEVGSLDARRHGRGGFEGLSEGEDVGVCEFHTHTISAALYSCKHEIAEIDGERILCGCEV